MIASAAVACAVGLTFFRRAKCIASLSSVEPFFLTNAARASAFLADAAIKRIRIADICWVKSSTSLSAGTSSPFQRRISGVCIVNRVFLIKSLPKLSKRAFSKSCIGWKSWFVINSPTALVKVVDVLDKRIFSKSASILAFCFLASAACCLVTFGFVYSAVNNLSVIRIKSCMAELCLSVMLNILRIDCTKRVNNSSINEDLVPEYIPGACSKNSCIAGWDIP